MDLAIDLTKTLEQLENADWGQPEFASSLIETCHRLRKVPLRDLRPQDLRIMIGQEVGLRFLVPLAVEQLRRDVFLISEFQKGDLLVSVLSVEPTFWNGHPRLRRSVAALAGEAEQRLLELPADTRADTKDALRRFNGQE